MRARLGAALVMAMSVALLAALPAAAITKHYQRDSDHPFVGLIVFYAPDGTIEDESDGVPDFSHRCSGSLIDPHTFVTAGHCTDDENGGVMRIRPDLVQPGRRHVLRPQDGRGPE